MPITRDTLQRALGRIGEGVRGAVTRVQTGLRAPGGWIGPEGAITPQHLGATIKGAAGTVIGGGRMPTFVETGRVIPGEIFPGAEAVVPQQLPAAVGLRAVPTRQYAEPIGPQRPATPAAIERAAERARAETPAPSQPAVPPAPEFVARPPTPVRPMPAVEPTPAMPAAAEARPPVLTPAAAPTPSPLPPAPVLPGRAVAEAREVPTPAALPPRPVLPHEIGRQQAEAPLGQFDAMVRALQAMQGGRFIQMPTPFGAEFGPAGAQAEALRRLRERELARLGVGI